MDYCILTTFNRKPQVEALVASIQQVFAGKIIVFNDGGEKPDLSGCELISYSHNHGKRGYYRLVTDIFSLLHPKRNKVDRFYLLPDDVIISPDLFTRSVALWEAIKDERKICLSLAHAHGRHLLPCWTYFKPVPMGDVVLTQWNDLFFMAEGRFLEELNYQIEKPFSGYDYRSSGVGRHISRTLHNKQWNMYHVNESLATFMDIETQMHRVCQSKIII